MRDLLFLVADKNMEYALRGFFERDSWQRSVPCAPFGFDVRQDIRVAVGQHDPGLYKRADALLQPFAGQYHHAVVMADAEWAGTPGADKMRTRLQEHVESAGWKENTGLALVFDPEVDLWLWAASTHTAKALGWEAWPPLRQALVEAKMLESEATKPSRPKEAAEWALRERKKPRSSSVYRHVTHRVSLQRCSEPSLVDLLTALRSWFPCPK